VAPVVGVEAVEAVHVGPDEMERRVSLGELGRVDLELGRPVRSFPSFRGQRSYPGWYWSATMGALVGFESWVERDHLIALDFDPWVRAVVSQPFWLVWRTSAGVVRRHAPDFFARGPGREALVVDSRPLDLIEERDAEAFAVTQRACDLLGWRYVVWGSVGGVVAANHRWLAGYRHPRCFEPVVAAGLRSVFARPKALMAGAEAVGDPIGVLPVLFHLMWRHELAADLSLVLGDRTWVRTVNGSGRAAVVVDVAVADGAPAVGLGAGDG
jgi:hypothetical protein